MCDQTNHDDRSQQSDFDPEMKAVKCLLEARVGVPLLAQLHAGIGEDEAPRPRTDEGIDVKAELRHLGDACREGDEGTHYGQQTPEQNCDALRSVLKK